jgi:hypothetical protein|tara:strand:- start:1383 stop:1637 length:255 start_codon:yes stop_codon:yes gene_type:complete
MPYLKPKQRSKSSLKEAGDLNFRIHELIEIYLNGKDVVKYEEYNSVVGVLESVKLEFYRRAVAAYEDNKIVENGDISLYTDKDE